VAGDLIDVDALKKQLRGFCEERQWMYVYKVRNLAMAASVEMGEALEVLQWLTDDELDNLSIEKTNELADEIADTMNNLVMLSDVLGINLHETIQHKIKKNAKKYPA
jgi:NTP pyrophosphatase (non-canonical NTP hydrolase)